MFKSAIIFRIEAGWQQPSIVALEEALGLARFAPCGATERESFGWVEPRGEKNGPLVEVVGGELIFKMMGESKMLPSSVVKELLDERCEKIEADTGRKPGSKAKKELKAELELELLPKAFTKKGATMMWVSPKAGLLVVDAGSLKKADRLVNAFMAAMVEVGSEIKLRPLNTATSPATAMSLWLTTQEAPAGFSVDRDCELKSTEGEKSSVRYSRHTLDIKEVVEHIEKQGKEPTKLAMTHKSRVSFMLCGDLGLKKVEALDGAKADISEKDSGFDADVTIITGELSLLIPDLIEALGGEQDFGAEAVEAKLSAPAPAGQSASATSVAGGESDAAPWDAFIGDGEGAAAVIESVEA